MCLELPRLSDLNCLLLLAVGVAAADVLPSPAHGQQALEPVVQVNPLEGNAVGQLEFTPDGRYLVASAGQVVRVFTAPELRLFREWNAGEADQVRLAGGGKAVVSCGDSLIVWNLLRDEPESAYRLGTSTSARESFADDVLVYERTSCADGSELERLREPVDPRVSLAFLPKVPSASDSLFAFEWANSIRAQIIGGASFADVSLAELGQELPTGEPEWFIRDELLDPRYTEVVFSEPIGRVSDPFLNSYGYYELVQVIERTEQQARVHSVAVPIEPSERTLDEVRVRADDLHSAVLRDGMNAALRYPGVVLYEDLSVTSYLDGVGSLYDVSDWAGSATGSFQPAGAVSPVIENEEGFVIARMEEVVTGWEVPLETDAGFSLVRVHEAALSTGTSTRQPPGAGRARLDDSITPAPAWLETSGAAYHAGTNILAIGTDDRAIQLHDGTTGALLARFPRFLGHLDNIEALAFSGDGRLLASHDGDELLIWDVLERDFLREIRGVALAVGSGLAFSSSGELVAISPISGGLELWNARTGELVASLTEGPMDGTGLLAGVSAIAFHPDPDARMLAVAWDGGQISGTISLWQWDRAEPLTTRESAWSPQNALAISPDGRWLAFAGPVPEAAHLFDLTGRQAPRTLEGHAEEIRVLAFSPDGRRLATGGFGGDVKIWDTESGREQRSIEAYPEYVRALSFSPDGMTLASGGDYPEIKLWDVDTGRQLRAIDAGLCDFCIDNIGHLAFLSDGTLAVAAKRYDSPVYPGVNFQNSSTQLQVWDPVSGERIELQEAEIDVEELAVVGDHLVAATYEGLWGFQVAGLASLFTNPDVDAIESVSGTTALRMRDGAIWIVRGTESASTVVRLGGELPFGALFALTPDGRRVIVTEGPILRILDALEGDELGQIVLDPGSSDWLVVSPEGRFDSSPGAREWIAWRTEEGVVRGTEDPALLRRFQTPGLLERLLSGGGPR